MIPARPAAAAALAAGAALLCAAAALLVRRIDGDPWVGAAIVGAVALCPAAAAATLVHRARRAELARADRLRRLAERLHVSASEAESRSLLLHQAQRILPRAGAVMLSRMESEERLEPVFGERIGDTPLRGLLVGNPRPNACLAVRLARTQSRSSMQAASAGCELCGRLAGESVCEPLQVGGRMLGSLLVASVDPIEADARAELRAVTACAAPLLALQRTVAAADLHPGRDSLTGLANRSAAADALARLSAQAGRTVTPLAAVLVDLDRFTEVNDRFGHEHGDGALAEVATALAGGVRASDLVARYGGQAFLVLAPDTFRVGAAALAEKLRREIEELSLAGGSRLTASFGVASLPEDAADGDGLLRRAERALGLAKALGRNRVSTPEPSPAPGG